MGTAVGGVKRGLFGEDVLVGAPPKLSKFGTVNEQSRPGYEPPDRPTPLDKAEDEDLVIAIAASLDDIMLASATQAGFIIPATCVGFLSARPAALPMRPRNHCAYCVVCDNLAWAFSITSKITCPLCRAPLGLDKGQSTNSSSLWLLCP